MQMIQNSLLPEALAKFKAEEGLKGLFSETVFNHADLEGSSPVDHSRERAAQLTAAIKAKRDQQAEEADRMECAKRLERRLASATESAR